MTSGKENGFLPDPGEDDKADILYICSPNNPTGAVFSYEQLQKWVDFANENGSVTFLMQRTKLLLRKIFLIVFLN